MNRECRGNDDTPFLIFERLSMATRRILRSRYQHISSHSLSFVFHRQNVIEDNLSRAKTELGFSSIVSRNDKSCD